MDVNRRRIAAKLALENAPPIEIATELKRSLPAIKVRAYRLGISLGGIPRSKGTTSAR
jgi:hypothetical protein